MVALEAVAASRAGGPQVQDTGRHRLANAGTGGADGQRDSRARRNGGQGRERRGKRRGRHGKYRRRCGSWEKGLCCPKCQRFGQIASFAPLAVLPARSRCRLREPGVLEEANQLARFDGRSWGVLEDCSGVGTSQWAGRLGQEQAGSSSTEEERPFCGEERLLSKVPAFWGDPGFRRGRLALSGAGALRDDRSASRLRPPGLGGTGDALWSQDVAVGW